MSEIAIPSPGDKIEIKPLTALCFIAALAVFVLHLSSLSERPALGFDLRPFFGEGYIGVMFFFILSGFILTLNYYHKIITWQAVELKKFYISRIARIFPFHLLAFCVAFWLFFQAPFSFRDGIQTILNLSLLQSFVPNRWAYWSFDSPAWSLSAEMFYYALFPLLLAFLVRARATTHRAFYWMLSLWIVGLAFVWVFRDSELDEWLTYVSPYLQSVNFAIGVLLCFVFLLLHNSLSVAKTPADRRVLFLFTLIELASLGVLAIELYVSPRVDISFRQSFYYTPAFGLIIIVFAFQKGYLSLWLPKPYAVMLGEISFAFYMFHRLILVLFDKADLFAINPVAASVAALLASIAVSYICYHFYESPSRGALRRNLPLLFGRISASHSKPRLDLGGQNDNVPVGYRMGINIGAVVLIGTVVVVTYWQSFNLGFADGIWNFFEAAQRLTRSQFLSYAFDPRAQLIDYRPMQRMVFYGEYIGFGSDLASYGIMRVLIHAADALLLFGVIRQVTKNWRVALAAGVLFAGLPLVAGSALDLMDPQPEALFLGLLCALFWMRFLQKKKRAYEVLALIACALALLTKETSAVLVVGLALTDRFVLRSDSRPAEWFIRDISSLHDRVPDETFLYFIDPQSTRDMRGLAWRYGKSILVGSSSNDAYLNDDYYPSLARISLPVPITGAGENQMAGLRDHPSSLIYYFDEQGKPIQVEVSKVQTSRAAPELPSNFQSLQLNGYELSSNKVRHSDVLVLLLYWIAIEKQNEDYSVVVHLVDSRGIIASGYEGPPGIGRMPTTHLEPATMFVDPIILPIAADTAAGLYHLGVGLSLHSTSQRLSLENGSDHIIISPIEILE